MKKRKIVSVLLVLTLLVTSILSTPRLQTTASKASAKKSAKGTSYGLSNPVTTNGVTTWDTVYFGNYYQNDTNGDGTADENDAKQPIRWRVLSVNGDDAFLLADQNLDARAYNTELTDITWAACTLRTWLNSTFLTTAFTSAEQSAIKNTNVVNDDNPFYGTEGGVNTTDKVYLLSIDEARNASYGFNTEFFAESESRQAKNTAYAEARGAWTSTSTEHEGNGFWWLRSPGYFSDIAADVNFYGWGYNFGNSVHYDGDAVRPALHLSLSDSSLWSKGEKVSANVGEGSGTNPTPTPATNPTPTPDDDTNSSGILSQKKFNLFNTVGGSVANSDIADFFVNDVKFKSPTFPVKVKKEQKGDGSYKVKVSIGIGKSDLLDDDDSWNQYKSCVKKAKDGKLRMTALKQRMKQYGTKWESTSFSEKFSAKPEISVMGYYELNCDKNNNIIKQEGGVTGTAEWSAKKTWQHIMVIGPVPVPFYLELSGKIELELALGISFSEGTSWKKTGSLKLSPSLSLGAGLGVCGAATIGVSGNAKVTAQILPVSKGTWEASLNLEAYIVFVLDWQKKLTGVKGTLWGGSKSSKSIKEALSDIDGGQLKKINRSYNKSTKWKGGTADAQKTKGRTQKSNYSSTKEKLLIQSVMPNTVPKVIALGDKQIFIFQSDDKSRTTENCACLNYIVYDGKTYTEPKPVEADGTLDMYADARVVNGTLYVAWQDVNKVLSTIDDEETLLGEIAKDSDISIARFDPSTNTFVDVKKITSDSTLDMMPRLVQDTDSVRVAWVSNTANNCYGKAGTNQIKTAMLSGGTWGTAELVGETTEYISEMTASYQDDTVKAAYQSTDIQNVEAGDEMVASTYLAADGTTTKISGEDATSSVQILDGMVTYLENNHLKTYEIASGTEHEVYAGTEDTGAVIASSYQIHKSGDKTSLVWAVPQGDTGYQILTSTKLADGTYSAPVTLYESTANVIQLFDSALLSNGNWSFIANTKNAEDVCSLYHIGKESNPLLELDYVDANEEERKNGVQPVDFSVTNTGEVPINSFSYKIFDDVKTYKNEVVTDTIQPGETKNYTKQVDLSSVTAETDVQVSVQTEEQQEFANTQDSINVGKPDVSIQAEKEANGESIVFKASVKNESEFTANPTVTLTDLQTGAVVGSKKLDAMLPASEKECSFTLDSKDVNMGALPAKYYKIDVALDENEDNLENNVVYETVYSNEIAGSATPTPPPTATPIIPQSTPTPPVVVTKPPVTKVTTPSKAIIVSAKNKKGKKISVSIKKISGAKGYQLQFATNKKFKKAKTILTKKTTLTIKKLKKKTYYFRARAYKLNGSKKVYGKWSSVKKVKVKK